MKIKNTSAIHRLCPVLLLAVILLTACGTEDSDVDAKVGGLWSGVYNWNCGGHGQVTIDLALTQEGSSVSGTASYLNDVTSVNGKVNGNIVSLFFTRTPLITNNYFTGLAAGNALVGTTMNGENCSAPAGPGGSISVSRSSLGHQPEKLAVVGPSYVRSSTCSDAFTAEARDAGGTTPQAVASSTEVLLNTVGTGKFYADRLCNHEVKSVVIPVNGINKNFFFKDSIVEDTSVSVSTLSGILTSATRTVRVMGHGGTVAFDVDGVPMSFSEETTAHIDFNHIGIFAAGANHGGMVHFSMPTIPGTYSCSLADFIYQNGDRQQWHAFYSVGSCTITVTSVGEIGQPITGTFSGVLSPQFNATTTVTLTNGTFSVIREYPL